MRFVVCGFESQPVDSDVQILLDAYRRTYFFSRYKEVSVIIGMAFPEFFRELDYLVGSVLVSCITS